MTEGGQSYPSGCGSGFEVGASPGNSLVSTEDCGPPAGRGLGPGWFYPEWNIYPELWGSGDLEPAQDQRAWTG